MHCTVVISSKSPGLGGGLTYDTGSVEVKPGSFIRVPLRKSFVEGVVLAVQEAKASEKFDVKAIEGLLSGEPLLTEAQIKTLRWMSAHYYCSMRSALSAFLPSPPWSQLLPKKVLMYKLDASKDIEKVRGNKRIAVIDFLKGRDKATKQEVIVATGASTKTLKDLMEASLLIEESVLDQSDTQPATYELAETPPALTEIQEKAYQEIIADKRPSLLFGVTGSGKTEIYAHLIKDAAALGKQSILLVPEILLTENSLTRFQRMFDRDKIAIIHSRLTPSARRTEWRKIRNGQAALIIGSRSALFSPCQNLGLIILDEEHEWTYKNEQTPRYHARETAEILTRHTGARLVYGSATPSLESWSRTKEGRYQLVRLPERFMNRPLATVRVIDLATVRFNSMYPFSPPLLEAIGKRLKRGEQSVLFLNRRGIATSILCLECRKRLLSPDTQMPYTLHRSMGGRSFLMDHISGATLPIPANCPHCGSHTLTAVGAGTQKLEDILTSFFPEARMLRADSDTLKHPEQMRLILQKMAEGQADILLGTQSVVKGLDLPGVTLAAVLVADVGLSLPHFRAGERVMQLLTQLTGRSGRTIPGEVIIQTFRPKSLEVIAAATHATEHYLEQEWALRLAAKYPPAVQMIRLIISGQNAQSSARGLYVTMEKAIDDMKLDVKATCSPTLFGGGKVWHILLRGSEPRALLTAVPLEGVTVDVDPVDCV